jgi:hypothetical protein
MKINQAFLHGFLTQDKVTAPLTIVGDDNSLTLTKGEGFDEWLADTTGIIDTQDLGHEVPFNERNFQIIETLIGAWLHGVELEGWTDDEQA